MAEAKDILSEFSDRIEKILVEFSINEESALKLMNKLKEALQKKYEINGDSELFEACVYNALATINTVPGQNKKTMQLLYALTEAKEEIKAIMEYM